nr:MAG TPA: hypothetical protein [Caudoviricetes sp.]
MKNVKNSVKFLAVYPILFFACGLAILSPNFLPTRMRTSSKFSITVLFSCLPYYSLTLPPY